MYAKSRAGIRSTAPVYFYFIFESSIIHKPCYKYITNRFTTILELNELRKKTPTKQFYTIPNRKSIYILEFSAHLNIAKFLLRSSNHQIYLFPPIPFLSCSAVLVFADLKSLYTPPGQQLAPSR